MHAEDDDYGDWTGCGKLLFGGIGVLLGALALAAVAGVMIGARL